MGLENTRLNLPDSVVNNDSGVQFLRNNGMAHPEGYGGNSNSFLYQPDSSPMPVDPPVNRPASTPGGLPGSYPTGIPIGSGPGSSVSPPSGTPSPLATPTSSSSTPTPPTSPLPGPTQQFKWAQGGGPDPGQLNAAAPDNPLSPEYANMQSNVAAAIAKNQQKPANFSIATNDPNIWLSPEGGTWMTPGYSPNNGQGINPSQVYGTNPSLNVPLYNLPGGRYWQNPGGGSNGGQLTQVTTPQQALSLINSLPNRGANSNPLALLAGAAAGNTPIRTSADYTAAGNAGNALINPSTSTTPPATTTPATTTSSSSSSSTPPANQQQINNLLAAISSGNATSAAQILQTLMGGSSPTTANTTQTSPSTSQPSPGNVMIGGQQMRWDPVNQYYVPVNPIPYGQGGGEST